MAVRGDTSEFLAQYRYKKFAVITGLISSLFSASASFGYGFLALFWLAPVGYFSGVIVGKLYIFIMDLVSRRLWRGSANYIVSAIVLGLVGIPLGAASGFVSASCAHSIFIYSGGAFIAQTGIAFGCFVGGVWGLLGSFLTWPVIGLKKETEDLPNDRT